MHPLDYFEKVRRYNAPLDLSADPIRLSLGGTVEALVLKAECNSVWYTFYWGLQALGSALGPV
jgi:hypothetical protein